MSRYQIDRVFDLQGIKRRTMVEAGNHEAVCNFVAEGVGVSIISPFFEHQLRNMPNLVCRPFNPTLIREIGMIVNDEHLSLMGKAFRDFVLDYFRNHAELTV